jgi:uncharacterized protein
LKTLTVCGHHRHSNTLHADATIDGVTDTWHVTDNQAASRFELTVDGHLAELQYRRNGKRFVLVHTGVPPELEGHGLGSALMAAAMDRAAAEDLTVVTLCPFARSWLARHPDVAATLTIDWGAGGGNRPPDAVRL